MMSYSLLIGSMMLLTSLITRDVVVVDVVVDVVVV